MRRGARIGVAICVAMLGMACSHVTSAREGATTQPPVADSPDAGLASPRPKAPPNTSGTSAKPTTERAAAAPGRPALSTSPEGLMLPEGPGLIQEALRQRGYLTDDDSRKLDAKTTHALQRFQAENGLPSTGAPDRDTLRKLGLSPSKVFRGPNQ